MRPAGCATTKRGLTSTISPASADKSFWGNSNNSNNENNGKIIVIIVITIIMIIVIIVIIVIMVTVVMGFLTNMP